MKRCLVLVQRLASAGPYGVTELLGLGYELVEVAPATSRVHVKVRDVVEHRSGRPLDKALRSVPKVLHTDVVLAFLEREALAPSWLRARRIPPYSERPLAMIACWLSDELKSLTKGERRSRAKAYNGVDLTMVFSSNQVDVLEDAGFRSGSVETINFGFAPSLFPRADKDGEPALVSVGVDRGRDYPTLLNAMGETDALLDLYCREQNLQGHPLPTNVSFKGTVPFGEYRRVLARATAVLVPTRVMAYPTGQSVALEAAGTGAALVLTDTEPMREYFTDETAMFVPSGDVTAWRDAIQSISHDRDLRVSLGRRAADLVHSRFTYQHMWSQVDQLFKSRNWV